MKSDIILNIELDRKKSVVHVLKRPGVEEFLQKMSRHYEVVIFTASVSAYANPLINQLDTKKNVSYRQIQKALYIFKWELRERYEEIGKKFERCDNFRCKSRYFNKYTLE